MEYKTSLSDQTALITGGARGIGAATAVALAARGAKVHVTDVLTCDDVVDTIQASGGQGYAHRLDVTDKKACQELIQQIAENHEGIDILICNAGLCPEGLGVDNEKQWQKVMDVNLFGAQNCAAAAWDFMVNKGYGRIVMVSSMAFYQGGVIVGPEYSTSKAALIGLTRHLARIGGEHGILVNAVAPGIIDTDMTSGFNKPELNTIPVRRYGTSEDVAGPISFLCGPESAYMTGTVLNVTGGMVLAA